MKRLVTDTSSELGHHPPQSTKTYLTFLHILKLQTMKMTVPNVKCHISPQCLQHILLWSSPVPDDEGPHPHLVPSSSRIPTRYIFALHLRIIIPTASPLPKSHPHSIPSYPWLTTIIHPQPQFPSHHHVRGHVSCAGPHLQPPYPPPYAIGKS